MAKRRRLDGSDAPDVAEEEAEEPLEQAPWQPGETFPRPLNHQLTRRGLATFVRQTLAKIAVDPLHLFHRGGNLIPGSAAPGVDLRAALEEALRGKLYDLGVQPLQDHTRARLGNEQRFTVHVYASREAMPKHIQHNPQDRHGCVHYYSM